MSIDVQLDDRIAITGIGMITSVGADRESSWQAIRNGVSGVRRVTGLQDIEDFAFLGAPVDLPADPHGRLKSLQLSELTAAEAIADSGILDGPVNRERFGCAISAAMGDIGFIRGRYREPAPDAIEWWKQWLPDTACIEVAERYQLKGPRMCHSAACASGLAEILSAVRSIRDDQCDVAIAGSAEALHPLLVSGFQAMRVLATHDDPTQASRPFDSQRSGFVMGEGAAMFVLERLSHALERNAPIYAEIVGGGMQTDSYHMTGLNAESETLSYLISRTLRHSGVRPSEIDYINAHGTGTRQNDVMETRGIRRSLREAADQVMVSSNKSMLGHLVSAAGSVEFAITVLALRDGFAPPTINLTHPDPECDLDYVPLVGRQQDLQLGMKLSIAFGGHLAAIVARRWPHSAAQEIPRRRAA